MTNTTPTPGNDTGLPAPATDPSLTQYLADMQARACRLAGLTASIAFLENEEKCGEGKTTLIYIAEELADELYIALDTVNIPNGEIR